MLQTEKNNVFLSSWYNAVYDFMMVDSVRDDDAPLDSIPLFHFFANIMMEVYPDNTIFKKFLKDENLYEIKNKQHSSHYLQNGNQTLWDTKLASYFGTYWTEIQDETKYFQEDIKKGDIFLIYTKNAPPQIQQRYVPAIYIGNNYMLGHCGYELENINVIEESTLTEKNSSLAGVLRYNFNRTDSHTPSDTKDIEIWEDFWDEEYVALNTFSYNKIRSTLAKRELVAEIDIVDNNVNINTDISPTPYLQDFSEIWLLDDCLCCFREDIIKENEYARNLELLPSFEMCGGIWSARYNWTLRFNASKYNVIKNYLELNKLSYNKIN